MGELVAIRGPERPIPRQEHPCLVDLDHEGLAAHLGATVGGPRYRADQIFAWLHARRARSFEAMTDLPKGLREKLAQTSSLPALELLVDRVAADGTRKLGLRTPDGALLETVLIPNEDRGLTQCISSMVGCSLTCRFCATATLGFVRNLATWEIVDQVYRAQDLLAEQAEASGSDWAPRVTNLVFMGMGEPLHNYNQVKRAIGILTDPKGANLSGRRITISTAGMVPAIERFGREGLGEEVGLAVSLNATTDEVRDQVMPINTRWNIATLLDTVRDLPMPRRRRITFEYVLLRGVNDTDADAKRLVRLVGDMRSQINLIPFNPHPGAAYQRPDPARVDAFADILRRSRMRVFLRRPRGDDIGAACGQLAAEGAP